MSGSNEVQAVAQALLFEFSDRGLLESALSHSSYVNEFQAVASKQSTLAFEDDAIIKTAASFLVTERLPGANTGTLTRHRDALVREATVASKARELGIHRALRLGRGVEREGGRSNPGILGEALEACIGAIVADTNDSGVQAIAVARNLLAPLLHTPALRARSAKSELQELCVRLHEGFPAYEVVEQHGPPHARRTHLFSSSSARRLGACSVEGRAHPRQLLTRLQHW